MDSVRTMVDVIAEAMGSWKGMAGLLSLLAAGALLLAAGRIYGVISYAVGSRVHGLAFPPHSGHLGSGSRRWW